MSMGFDYLLKFVNLSLPYTIMTQNLPFQASKAT